jgi:hypothetical protein
MTRSARLLVLSSFVLASAAVAIAGCVSDSPSPQAGLDGGPGGLPDGAPANVDSGSAATDGATPDTDADAGGDAQTVGDAGTDAEVDASSPLTTCDPLQRIDTIRGVNGASTISAAGSGDEWAVTWFQTAAVSPDAEAHWKGRFFDGAALATEQDLGTDTSITQSPTVADGAGHAFAQRFEGAGGERRVFDFSTGLFAAGESVPIAHSGFDSMALAAIPGGGAISLYRDGTNVLADKWLPAQPAWTTTGLAGLPALSFGLRVVTNAAGKAAALWYVSVTGGTDVTVTTYDGATWSAPATKNFPDADGTMGRIEPAIFSNGDVLIAWAQGPSTLSTVRLAAATGTFAAPVPIDTTSGATAGGLDVVVDASDRITVAWILAGHVFVRRDLGAGFLAPEDAGASDAFRLDLDRATSQVSLLTYSLPNLAIRRIGPTSDTLGPAITTGVGISNGMNLKRDASVVFDTSGRPTVIAMQSLTGPGGFGLAYAKCH